MSASIVTYRELWAPNMVKSMQLLEAVLNEQPRATVMDPRAGIVPTCPRLIAVVLAQGRLRPYLSPEHQGHGRYRTSLQFQH